jgi:hypothetical protein
MPFVNANVNGGCVAPTREARGAFAFAFAFAFTFGCGELSHPRARACASARIGALTRVGRDNETITERDETVYVYVSRRVSAPMGRKRAVDIDIDHHGA